MANLRVGLIGMGVMGNNHARILSTLDGVTLVGIADPARSGETMAGVTIQSDMAQLVKLGLDYAVVATPTGMHEEVALALADKGVHALIEKPLAPTSQESTAIAQAFRSAGLLGGVGHIERFNPALQEARRRISKGQLGSLLQVATRRQGPFPARIADVGVVMDLGTHDIDLTSWVTQQAYSQISAVTALKTGREHEDMVSISATLDGGAIATHLVNWLSPFKERTITIIGESGAFVVDTLTADLTFHANGAGFEGWDEISTFRGVQPGDIIRYAFARPEPLRLEHESFRDAILGSETPIVTLDEGLEIVRVAEATLQSAKTGVTINLQRGEK